jgi:flagellar export protein FliJ
MRLYRFDVDEKRRQVTDIEVMINEFKRMAADLDRQIEVEQENAGICDVNHYAYPTFAKAAIQRRDNLLASVSELESKLEKARDELSEAFEELKKVELLDERETERDIRELDKREQSQLDEVASNALHGTYS